MENAAEWYGLLRSGEADDIDRQRWQEWYEASPEHRQAWQYVEAVSRHFSIIKERSDSRALADGVYNANQRAVGRRQMLLSLAAMAGAGALGWFSWQTTPLPQIVQRWRADHSSETGEIKDLVLSDGSHIWLNTATAFNQHYSRYRRNLQLLTGEVFISTAGDAKRPFVVTTPHGSMKALGTKFTVQLKQDKTLLAVYDGAVEITNTQGERKVIKRGEQLIFSHDTLGSVGATDESRRMWSKDLFIARNIPLRDVVDELRRYRSGHIGLAPEVADLKVFGSFPLQDTNKALDLLAYALPVKVKQTLPWWVSIEAE